MHTPAQAFLGRSYFLRSPLYRAGGTALAIGEIVDSSAPLPVTIRGEDAGRQVRGSANADG